MCGEEKNNKSKKIFVFKKAKQNNLFIFDFFGWPSCSKTPKGCLREVLIYFLPLEFVVKHSTVFDVKVFRKSHMRKRESCVVSICIGSGTDAEYINYNLLFQNKMVIFIVLLVMCDLLRV